MLYLKIPENTAYNPMIYIPFFIVILVDKRDAKRDAKARTQVRTQNDTKNVHRTKRGKHTPSTHRAHTEHTPSTRGKEASSTASTPPENEKEV